jgi:hypothetical protein
MSGGIINKLNSFSILSKDGRKQIEEAKNRENKKNGKSKNKTKAQTFKNDNSKNNDSVDKNVLADKNGSADKNVKKFGTEENNLNDLKKMLFGNSDVNNDKKENDTVSENADLNETELFENTCGKNKYLNSPWTVWVHRNDDMEDWSDKSFKDIHVIDSISTFWEFFNNFHKINKEDNQYRKGGTCSLKIDCYDRNNKFDIGCEFMMCFCLLIMNESLMQDNNEINGVSYSIRHRSIYIKIWTRDFNYNIEDKIPKNLLTKFNNVVRANVYKKFDNYISIIYKPIKPED